MADGGECRRRRRVTCVYVCSRGKSGGDRVFLDTGTGVNFPRTAHCYLIGIFQRGASVESFDGELESRAFHRSPTSYIVSPSLLTHYHPTPRQTSQNLVLCLTVLTHRGLAESKVSKLGY